MPNETKTPLETIQAEVAEYLDPWNMTAITRAALDAFLVEAFDAGAKAQRELAAEQVQLSGRLSVSDPVPDWNPLPKN